MRWCSKRLNLSRDFTKRLETITSKNVQLQSSSSESVTYKMVGEVRKMVMFPSYKYAWHSGQRRYMSNYTLCEPMLRMPSLAHLTTIHNLHTPNFGLNGRARKGTYLTGRHRSACPSLESASLASDRSVSTNIYEE